MCGATRRDGDRECWRCGTVYPQRKKPQVRNVGLVDYTTLSPEDRREMQAAHLRLLERTAQERNYKRLGFLPIPRPLGRVAGAGGIVRERDSGGHSRCTGDLPDVCLWRNHVGQLTDVTGAVHPFGLAVGSADLDRRACSERSIDRARVQITHGTTAARAARLARGGAEVWWVLLMRRTQRRRGIGSG